VDEGIGWDSRLQVTADGKGLIKDAGLVLLRKTADVRGLTDRLAEAFGPGRVERIDRGVVLASAAVAIAAGARNLSAVERVLAHHGGTFGVTGSDSTLWRALDSVDDRRLRRLQSARRRARKTARRQIAKRPGGFPWLTIGARHLDKWIVVDLDATLVECHSAKQNAAGTYKGGFGVHPLGGWVANTRETLAILPRAGNAGSNTAADHITVLDEVLDQLPDENKHSKVLVRIDGAGASHETIERIIAANHKRRRVAFTIGWTITDVEEAAIAALPEHVWAAYLRQDGTPATITHDGTETDYGHVADHRPAHTSRPTHGHAADRAPGPDHRPRPRGRQAHQPRATHRMEVRDHRDEHPNACAASPGPTTRSGSMSPAATTPSSRTGCASPSRPGSGTCPPHHGGSTPPGRCPPRSRPTSMPGPSSSASPTTACSRRPNPPRCARPSTGSPPAWPGTPDDAGSASTATTRTPTRSRPPGSASQPWQPDPGADHAPRTSRRSGTRPAGTGARSDTRPPSTPPNRPKTNQPNRSARATHHAKNRGQVSQSWKGL
jgi:hypothetical protein